MKEIILEGFKHKILAFDEEALCNKCSYPKDEKGCHSCAIFLSKSRHTGGTFYFERIFSVGEYYKKENLSTPFGSNLAENLSLLILSFKKKEKYSPYCAELLKMKFGEVFPELGESKENLAICSIPDMDTEIYQKGDALALEFSKRTGVPFYPLLKKVRETKKQHEIHSVQEKYENVKGVYEINKKFLKFFENKKIILIDDVITSLATVNECSKILLRSGIENIFVFSIGRSILDKEEDTLEESK